METTSTPPATEPDFAHGTRNESIDIKIALFIVVVVSAAAIVVLSPPFVLLVFILTLSTSINSGERNWKNIIYFTKQML